MFAHNCGEPQLPLSLPPASLPFCLQRIPFLIKGRRSRKEDVTICRTTTCQCAQSIRNFRECSKAVQVSVRGCLLFVSQGVLNGKEAFALLGQNGSSQMPDGMKTERFYPGLGKPFHYVGCQDAFYVHHQGREAHLPETFVDTDSKWVTGKLHTTKTPNTSADLLNDRVCPSSHRKWALSES